MQATACLSAEHSQNATGARKLSKLCSFENLPATRAQGKTWHGDHHVWHWRGSVSTTCHSYYCGFCCCIIIIIIIINIIMWRQLQA